MRKEIYTIEDKGDCWQSVFPTAEAQKSQLHPTIEDALRYMTQECGVDVIIPKCQASVSDPKPALAIMWMIAAYSHGLSHSEMYGPYVDKEQANEAIDGFQYIRPSYSGWFLFSVTGEWTKCD